jgi:hypothetical protein
MPRKQEPKKNPLQQFVMKWLYADSTVLAEAFRKEASRQVGEMQKWMDDQIDNDPMGMLWEFSESLFPLIQKAIKYRARIYDRNKRLRELEFDKVKASVAGDVEALEKAAEEWSVTEAEQIALAWRIKKIHIHVTSEVRLQLDKERGEKDPFADYEYNPENS